MHTLYLGPSWAVQSYESFNGDDLVRTNLASELGLKNYTQLADYGNSNSRQLDKALNFMRTNAHLGPFRILVVTSESLSDGHEKFNMTRENFALEFLLSDDPLTLIKDLEIKFYERLSSLEVPVALIGAHTDIVDFNFPSNFTVLHSSWQNFLAQQCGLDKFYGWPCEIANLWLQGRLDMTTHIKKINPSKAVVFEIDKLFSRWSTLQLNKLWNGVHPSILGNQLFSKEIANSFKQWIN